MRITLDPETLLLDAPSQFTGAEFQKFELPPCPVCGETIVLRRIDVTTLEELCGSPVEIRRYVPGQWYCVNECDPRDL